MTHLDESIDKLIANEFECQSTNEASKRYIVLQLIKEMDWYTDMQDSEQAVLSARSLIVD